MNMEERRDANCGEAYVTIHVPPGETCAEAETALAEGLALAPAHHVSDCEYLADRPEDAERNQPMPFNSKDHELPTGHHVSFHPFVREPIRLTFLREFGCGCVAASQRPQRPK